MGEKVKNLSLFFPAYNEVGNIQRTVEKAVPVLEKIAKDFEIIIIDDGSIDGTDKIVDQLSKENKRIRLVRHSKNLGYGAALRSGLTSAKYDLVAFNDGDGQFDFSEINKFLDKIKNYDLVIGYRKKRVDPLFRKIIQLCLKIWVKVIFGFTYKDIDCGFKLFKKVIIPKVLPVMSNGAMVSTEMLYRATKEKIPIYEVSVTHYPRKEGKQTGANLKVIFRAIKETFNLKLNRN